VALAHLLADDRAPAASLWSQTLVSSRLLEYELYGVADLAPLWRFVTSAADPRHGV